MQSHIKNKLTDQEKSFFLDNGYLTIPNAIDSYLISELLEDCKKLVDKSSNGFVNIADVLSRGGPYLKLATLPTILPKIVGLLGWNIWINHTHTNVHPPNCHHKNDDFEYGWHRDGGMVEEDLVEGEVPWFSIKVGFFLTDTQEKNSGTTYCIPKSHLDRRKLPDDFTLPSEAEAISIPAGSAVLMNPRIIHSIRSPNQMSISRNAIFIQWAYRWLQPTDAHTVSKLDKTVLSPYEKQLLGLTANPNALHEKYASGRSGYYYPNDDEVPLKEYALSLYGSTRKQDFQL